MWCGILCLISLSSSSQLTMEENRLKNGPSLVSKIQSVMKTDPDFPQKFKQRLLIESYQVTNPFQFISSLFSKGALGDGSSDKEELFALKEMIIQLAIRIACSRGTDAVVGLVETFEESGNLLFSEAIRTWFEDNFTIGANGDLSESEKQNALVLASRSEILRKEVKQPTTEESKLVGPEFLYQNVPPNELLKVATFNDQPESPATRTSALHFDKKGMMAGFNDGTVKIWNWVDNEEKAFKCGIHAVSCLQYDEEIMVFGSSDGTIYLYDARTLEEKWSMRLSCNGPIISLKFFKSTLVVFMGPWTNYKLWRVEISRSNIRLLNQRRIDTSKLGGKLTLGVLMDSYYCFVSVKTSAYLYSTESGISIRDEDGALICFTAPAEIRSLKLVDLVSMKRVLVAGCTNGDIVMWSTCDKVCANQGPFKTFRGHQQVIHRLCNISGHLISADVTGKVLMWSGYDLENPDAPEPVPRALRDFPNLNCLVEHDRWLASGKSTDGTIEIWTLPAMWLRTG